MVMAERHKRSGDRAAYWRAVVEGHSRSGLTVREYCRSVGVAVPSYYWWRAELTRRSADVKAPAKAEPGAAVFVPLRVGAPQRPQEMPAEAAVGGVEVLRGGHVLRLTGPVDRRILAELLAALEGTSC